MSLESHAPDPVPEQTARIARAAFLKDNILIKLRDELGAIYEHEAFAHLFPSRGKPGEVP